MVTWWPDQKINDFLNDLHRRQNPQVLATTVTNLADPMPQEVKDYYDGKPPLKYNQIKKIPCILKCHKCHLLIQSQWPSLLQAKSKGLHHEKYPSPIEECEVCQTEHKAAIILAIENKWNEYLKNYSEFCAEQPVVELSYSFYLKFFEIFQKNKDFLSCTWTIKGNFPEFKNLLRANLVTLRFIEGGIELKFVKCVVDQELCPVDHSELFYNWALKHIEAEANRVCYRNIEMSYKYFEDLEKPLNNSSYYQIAYALYRAEKEAIAAASMHKKPRSVTFLHVLLNSLKKLSTNEWQVSPGSKAVAQSNVGNDFWNLVRLKDHNLSVENILSTPLRMLSIAIENATSKELFNSSE